MGDLTHRFRYS